MNRRSTTIIRNPILNDFVYTVLYNASYEQKRGLMGKYMKASMNQKAARTFVAHSTRDEKEYVLSHLGFEFFYVVAKRGMTMSSMRDVLSKFDNKKQISAIKDIADAGLFVMSDRDFLRLLGFMAKTIHHPSYFLNLEIKRQGYNIQNWSKRANIQEDFQVRETDECSRIYAKTICNSALAMDFVPGIYGITKTSMKVLLYLYSYGGTQISYDSIFGHFAGAIVKTEFGYSLKELLGGELIMRIEDRVYTISGAGIKVVDRYMSHVSKLNELG